MDSPVAEASSIARRLITRRDMTVHCPACGRAAERKARQQRYCSARCKEKARQRTRKAFLGQDTGAPTNPHKFVNENNGLRTRKLRPSPGIFALPAVLHAELFAGRKWEPVTSADGVLCLVSWRAAP